MSLTSPLMSLTSPLILSWVPSILFPSTKYQHFFSIRFSGLIILFPFVIFQSYYPALRLNFPAHTAIHLTAGAGFSSHPLRLYDHSHLNLGILRCNLSTPSPRSPPDQRVR